MRTIREFDEFVKEGIVKKQAPDHSRAEFLAVESERSYKFLKTIVSDYRITDDNANTIIRLCYDILMESIRASMLRNGFNASGHWTHEAEVAYMKKIGLDENTVIFADRLRYFRNGIVYYGKILDAQYADKVIVFLNNVYSKLRRVVKR